jgi:hypothetical protein
VILCSRSEHGPYEGKPVGETLAVARRVKPISPLVPEANVAGVSIKMIAENPRGYRYAEWGAEPSVNAYKRLYAYKKRLSCVGRLCFVAK